MLFSSTVGGIVARRLSAPAPLRASNMVHNLIPAGDQRAPPAADKSLGFGKIFTDHIMEADWTKEHGWANPEIRPFGDLAIHPASSVLHYGIGVFEGMKAYRGSKGEVRLFRPDRNMARLARSCRRLALPYIDEAEALECVKAVVRADSRFIPSEDGFSLYIRPTVVGTHPNLGVATPEAAKFFTMLSPVGPYYPEGFKAVTLLAESKYVRAWVGGVGDAKVAGNYAPTILPAEEAAAKGFTQVLWLYGEDHWVSEVGTSNFFVLWRTEDGSLELVTPPLDDGTILPGVTRESLLELARGWGEFEVCERRFAMRELTAALKEGRVLEIFGSGTAAVVSPVKGIHFDGVDYDVPVDPEIGAGKYTARFLNELLDIQYGRVEHEWSVVI